MFNISILDALSIWSELEAALYGDNKYGGTVAEIYSIHVRPFSPTAWEGYKNQSKIGLLFDCLIEEATENGKTLYDLLQRFKTRHKCDFEIDGMTPEEALLETPFVGRCHVEVLTKDPTILAMRKAARATENKMCDGGLPCGDSPRVNVPKTAFPVVKTAAEAIEYLRNGCGVGIDCTDNTPEEIKAILQALTDYEAIGYKPRYSNALYAANDAEVLNDLLEWLKTPKCEHKNERHLADNGSCSAGCIHWCPDCGALSVTAFGGKERKWQFPGR